MNILPKISFGMIVFNGEPFTTYNLRALYPFAHEIIIVEGAAPGSASLATVDGHSTDGTLEALYEFKRNEDPENKVVLVIKDGVWEGEKDEMSQAYANKATGDYLWQIDGDEFYKPEDIQFVCNLLQDKPEITAVSFKQITFWGGIDYTVDSWYLRQGPEIIFRIFKWGKGYKYVTHRPPTIHDEQGNDVRKTNWIDGKDLFKKGIHIYHYSLLFPKQVLDKSKYYTHDIGKGTSTSPEWVANSYLTLKKPFRAHNVFNYPGWIERFNGSNPPEVNKMWEDALSGIIHVELRQSDDVELLLKSIWYPSGVILLKVAFKLRRWWKNVIRPKVVTFPTKLFAIWPLRLIRNLIYRDKYKNIQ